MTETPPSRDYTGLSVSIRQVSAPLNFADLFADHHDFVWRTLRYLGVAKPCLDDGTQDVFLVVHRRYDSYNPEVPLRAWLFGIVRRVADKYRVRAARPPPLRLLPDPSARSPEDELARQEAAAMIEEFLATLSMEQREVFVLAELEGLTAPAIAAATGVKLNTVYSRLRLARHAFERRLARHHAQVCREARDVKT